MMNDQVRKVIERLERDSKQGDAYDTGKGKGGWRNPIRNDTGLVLYNLVRARGASNAIEFGTAHGLSACYIAAGLQRGGLLHSIEFDVQVAQGAQANLDEATDGSGVGVGVLAGDALEMVNQLGEQGSRVKYEVVFLDAQKDQYRAYIEALQSWKLLAPNCLVIADNILDRATEVAPFMEYMKQYDNVAMPIGNAEGMAIAGLSIAVIS